MSDQQTLPSGHVWFLIIAIFVGFWSRIGSVPLFDLDEGAFSEATIEMIDSGNYLSTTLNGEPRYDKPIAIYWLQAASVQVFGKSEFAFRLPSAICASLWLLLVYHFTFRQTQERRAALVAASAVALGVMSSIIGHAAIADALLNLCIAGSMLGIYRYGEVPARPTLLAVYFWMGLGFLTKGPIAVALPLLVSLVFFLMQRRPLVWLRAAFNPLGWLVFLAVVAPWVWALYQMDHGEFLRHFLIDHNLNRYESTLQGHGGKWWYYFVALPLIVLPFTSLLPGVFARLRRPDALDRYLLLWFLVVFAFFSFSGTQLPHYLLYGATPLFVLFGRGWRTIPSRFWTLLPALIVVAAIASMPWVLPQIVVPEQRVYEAGIVTLAASSFTIFYYGLSGVALVALFVLMTYRRLERSDALLGAALVLTTVTMYGVLPTLAHAQQEPVQEAAQRARDLKLPVVSYRTFLPSFSVYRGEVTPNRLPAPGELVFVRLDRIEDLQRELGGNVTLIPEFRKGGVALLLRPEDSDGPPSAASPR
jgi:4-amino-4-deoxy-L-arabinose transferase-like glycosyltransferase